MQTTGSVPVCPQQRFQRQCFFSVETRTSQADPPRGSHSDRTGFLVTDLCIKHSKQLSVSASFVLEGASEAGPQAAGSWGDRMHTAV